MLQPHRERPSYGVPVVVAVNRFKDDTAAEMELVQEAAPRRPGPKMPSSAPTGPKAARAPSSWARRSSRRARSRSNFQFLYPLDMTIKEKIETIGTKSTAARASTTRPRPRRRSNCTPAWASTSCPSAWPRRTCPSATIRTSRARRPASRVPVREIRACVGAGFLYPLLGTMATMPGLSTRPGYFDIDIDTATGRIIGLS